MQLPFSNSTKVLKIAVEGAETEQIDNGKHDAMYAKKLAEFHIYEEPFVVGFADNHHVLTEDIEKELKARIDGAGGEFITLPYFFGDSETRPQGPEDTCPDKACESTDAKGTRYIVEHVSSKVAIASVVLLIGTRPNGKARLLRMSVFKLKHRGKDDEYITLYYPPEWMGLFTKEELQVNVKNRIEYLVDSGCASYEYTPQCALWMLYSTKIFATEYFEEDVYVPMSKMAKAITNSKHSFVPTPEKAEIKSAWKYLYNKNQPPPVSVDVGFGTRLESGGFFVGGPCMEEDDSLPLLPPSPVVAAAPSPKAAKATSSPKKTPSPATKAKSKARYVKWVTEPRVSKRHQEALPIVKAYTNKIMRGGVEFLAKHPEMQTRWRSYMALQRLMDALELVGKIHSDLDEDDVTFANMFIYETARVIGLRC